MTSWPTSLPQEVLVQGFQEQPQPQTLRSSMDAGPAKLRRRFSAKIVNYKFQLLLDATQKATLDVFHDATLAGGSLPFDWVDHIGGGARSYRFTKPPSYAASSPTAFAAQLELESLP